MPVRSAAVGSHFRAGDYHPRMIATWLPPVKPIVDLPARAKLARRLDLSCATGSRAAACPRGRARVLLRVIERDPEAVRRAIGQGLLDH